jgi:hypothetical protein
VPELNTVELLDVIDVVVLLTENPKRFVGERYKLKSTPLVGVPF